MEILSLIELISLSNSRLDTFYFEMKDTLEKTTSYAINYNGEQVNAREYPSVQITSHFTYGNEDAIAFLFDADIHLWKLISWEITRDWYESKQWTVKLQR